MSHNLYPQSSRPEQELRAIYLDGEHYPHLDELLAVQPPERYAERRTKVLYGEDCDADDLLKPIDLRAPLRVVTRQIVERPTDSSTFPEG